MGSAHLTLPIIVWDFRLIFNEIDQISTDVGSASNLVSSIYRTNFLIFRALSFKNLIYLLSKLAQKVIYQNIGYYYDKYSWKIWFLEFWNEFSLVITLCKLTPFDLCWTFNVPNTSTLSLRLTNSFVIKFAFTTIQSRLSVSHIN